MTVLDFTKEFNSNNRQAELNILEKCECTQKPNQSHVPHVHLTVINYRQVTKHIEGGAGI